MADSPNPLWLRTVPGRTATAAASDDTDRDDENGDDLGECAARAKMKTVAALTIKHAVDPWDSFQYSGLATHSQYTPHSRFEVVFHDDRESWRVVVTGRNLEAIYLNLISHRIDWLMPASRDFAGNKEPIILAIKVAPLAPPRAERPTPSVSAGTAKVLTPA